MIFYLADESRHVISNEHHGRMGELEVRGALLSSPCTLITNELELPLAREPGGSEPLSPAAGADGVW